VAERAGHAMHTALVKKLMQDRSAWELAYGYAEPAAETARAAQGLVSVTA
jgi:UDP-3-O-[3-hydroxymyristoyl] N-acetylglucosamine deacetylase